MMKRLSFALAMMTLLAIFFSPTLAQHAQTGALTHIAESSNNRIAISEDGRYVVFTGYDNLIPSDINGYFDVIIYDSQLGTFRLVSKAWDGGASNNNSYVWDISHNGRFITFASSATNLVQNDTNNKSDVFVYDQTADQIRRVSVSSTGAQSDGDSSLPVISGDGRYVAFMSGGKNLVAGDTNNSTDVFVHDLQTKQTTVVSVTSSGEFRTGNAGSALSISSDGRYVLFGSTANLVDTTGMNGYLHDRYTAQTYRVTRRYWDGGAPWTSLNPLRDISITDDGRYVVYISDASNITPNDYNGAADVYIYDRLLDQTTSITESTGAGGGNLVNYISSITSDGAYIVFTANPTNIIPDDTNNVRDVVLYHVATGTTELLSITATGMQGNADSAAAVLSNDASTVAFITEADNFAPVTGRYNLFVKSVILPTTPPTAPTLQTPITGTSTTDTNTTFSWDSVSGATAYQIQFATDSDFIQVQAEQTVSDPNITLSLTPNNYYWRIRAKNGGLFGVWSETRTFSRIFASTPLLISPADMTSTIYSNHTFTWDAVVGAEQYQLQIATDTEFNAPVFDTLSPTNSYTHTLTANGTYYWRVRAKNDDMTSDWSGVFTLIINPLSAPTLIAPADMTSTVDRYNTFMWSTVDNVHRYQLQIANDSDFTQVVRNYFVNAPTNSYYYDSGLPGTYYWRVRATNPTNNGDWSSVFSITVNLLPAPTLIAPADMTISTETAILLSWDAVPNVIEYRVFIAKNPTFTDELAVFDVGTNTSYIFSTTISGTYYWRVIPYFNEFIITPSETRQFTLNLLPIPTSLAPIDTTTTPASEVTFTWDAVAGATGYIVQINTNSYFGLSPDYFTSTNSYTHVFDTPTTYFWRVYAVNDLVASAYSPTYQVNLISLGTPNLVAPADMTTITSADMTFSWDAVTDATHYQLQISTDNTFASTVVNQSVSVTSYDYAFTEGGTYYWRVQATGTGIFSSGWSDIRQIMVDNSGILAPTLLTPTSNFITTNPTFSFTWSAVAGATAYEFQLSDSPDYSNLILSQMLTDTAVNSDMPLADTYYWRVRAKIGVLGGVWAGDTFTYNLYDAPSNLQPENNLIIIAPSADITLSWGDTVSHVTGYQIQISLYQDMFTPFVDTIISTNSYLYTFAPSGGGGIYWRVRGREGERFGVWSEIRKISIAPLPSPTLTSPADGIDVFTTAQTFTWEPVAGATSYSFQITHYPSFPGNTEIFTHTTTSRNYNLPPNHIRTYYWRVRANIAGGGQSLWSEPRVLTYKGLAAPTPLSPIGASLDSSPVTMSWSAVANATNYEVQVLDAATLELVAESLTGSTTYSAALTITKPGDYYWRVRSLQSATPGPWSANIPFTLTPLPTPLLVTPLNNYVDTDPTPTFTWQPVTGATSYRLQISYHADFGSLYINRDVGLNTSFTEPLSYGLYYWRVMAYKGSLGTPSESRYMQVKPLYTPLLIAPINLSTVLNNNVEFSWEAVADAETYQIQIGTSLSFSTILHDSTIATLSHTVLLNDGEGYFWRVRSLHSNGAVSLWSQGRFFTVNPLPAPNLVAPADMTSYINPSVAFSWDAVAGATGYDIQIARDNLFELLVVNQTVATTSHNYIFTAPNTYYWRVRAVKGSGKGNWSVGRQVIIESPPPPNLTAPADLSININPVMTFNWDAVANATSYQIQIAIDTGFTITMVTQTVTSNSYTYSLPYGIYLWRVRAQIDTLNGEWSSVYVFGIEPLSIPNMIAPSDMATITDPNVTFTWDTVAEATGYVIQMSDDETFATVIDEQPLATTSHTLFMPTAGAYYWRVRATEGDVSSEWSNIHTFAMEPLPIPSNTTPASGSVLYDANVIFSWDAVIGASEYQIRIATDSDMTQVIYDQTTTNTSQNYALPALGVYYWQVRATNTPLIGGWSSVNSLAILTVPPTLIAPADMTSATISDATFTWDAVAGATDYQIQISLNAGFSPVTFNHVVSNTSHTQTFVTPASYYWRVRVADNGDWSVVRQFTLTPHPAPNITAPADMVTIANSDVTFTWDAVAGVSQYRLEISTNRFFVIPLFYPVVNTTNHTQAFTTPATYYWRVQGISGEWSAVRQFTIQAPPAPNLITPSDMTTTPIADVNFSWDAVAGATDYSIQIATDSGFITIVHDQTVATTTYTHTVTIFGTYYWRVRAKQNTLSGAWSATREVTITPPLPATPNLIAPADGLITTHITHEFSWDVVADITSYQLQISTDNTFVTTLYDLSLTNNTHSQTFSIVGIYYWRVRAKNSNLDGAWSAIRQLTIQPLPAPTLLAPLAPITTPIVLFTWSAVDGATEYQIEISEFSDFSILKESRTLTGTSTQFILRVKINPYYWRVRAVKETVVGVWSDVGSFRLDPFPSPVIISPANGATTTNWVTFSWDAIPQADGYRIETSTNGVNFSRLTTVYNNYTEYTGNFEQGVYYWRVRAERAPEEGEWSEVRQFTVTNLYSPTLLTPENIPSYPPPMSATVTFSWTPVVNATSYQVVINGFGISGQIEYDLIVSDTTLTYTVDTPYSYRWRVRALNDYGVGYWTDDWYFSVAELPFPTNLVSSRDVNGSILYFDWDAVPNATQYEVQLSTDRFFSNVTHAVTVTDNHYQYAPPLMNNMYWSVRAVNGDGASLWSWKRIYYTMPTLVAPANMTAFSTPSIEFEWGEVDEATSYELEIATDDTFTTITQETMVATTSTLQTIAISDDYYWRVRGITDEGEGTWSEVRQFSIATVVSQALNEQELFNAMMPNLTHAFQFAIMDARPGGILTTLQFTDGTVADVMVNMTVDNGLILITLSDIAIQGGGTQAQLDTLYQDVPVMIMATLDDLLPEDYIHIESLTITDVGMSIEVIGAQP